MADFAQEFCKPALDLVPDHLLYQDLAACFAFMDPEKAGFIKEQDLLDNFEKHVPTNAELLEAVLAKGTEAPKDLVQDTIKSIPNLKKMKGRILPNPFIAALTQAPIEMSRLDAKFLSQMYKGADGVNCVPFMRVMGPINPPRFVLEQLKKAIVGSEINLGKMFKQYEERKQAVNEFVEYFSRAEYDLCPAEVYDADLVDCFALIDAKEKAGMLTLSSLEDSIENDVPKNFMIVLKILKNGTKASLKQIQAAQTKIPNFKENNGKVSILQFTKALTDKPISMSRLDAKFMAQVYRNHPSTNINALRLV